jgi:hypothetical protein
MKNLSVAGILFIFVITGCYNSSKTVNKQGSDKDPNGCVGSAGYTWSEIKNNCVQIFEVGTEFNAYGKNLDSTLAAYIIISDDLKKAEVFVPSNYSKEPVILVAAGPSKTDAVTTLYENTEKQFKIDQLRDKYLIVINNEPVFYQPCSKTNGLAKLLKK